MADEGETKKRRKAEDDGGIGDKAIKWAEEFDSLGEDDQYTYLEELAPRMSKMHLQFLQGIIGFDDDDEEEEELGEDDEEEGEEEDEEEEGGEED